MKPIFENVPIPCGGSFACLEFRGEKFDCPYHVHPEVEITWVIDGEGQRLVGDRLENFSPGDLVMVAGGLPHMYRNWSVGFARSRYIQFHRAVFGEEFFALPECRSVELLLDRAARGIAFSGETARGAGRKINRIHSLQPGPERLAMLLELLGFLASDASAALLTSAQFRADSSTSETARKVLQYIEDHWDGETRMEAAAQAAGLHPRSLSRFFRRCMGKTFQDYVGELRMGRAAREIIESDNRISEIAFSCGFNNLSHFNRLFLRMYGMNPKAYRAAMESGAVS